jgi:molecular chaperone DnaK (HSP70)/uncharacterized protein YegL
MAAAAKTAIGIDLGSTNSAAAFVDEDGRLRIIRDDQQKTIIPSVVQYPTADSVLVGMEAKRQSPLYPDATAQFFKRDMGTPAIYHLAGRDRTPMELSAEVLRHVRAMAEGDLGRPVRAAVVTVPAYFRDGQRRDTEEAARQAGLEPIETLNEPTAAAMAFGLDRGKCDERVLVYDLGGGTFDVSIVRIQPGGIEVLGSDGNSRLGGKDWDDLLLDFIVREFAARCGRQPLEDPLAALELRLRVEELKISLSARPRAGLMVSYGGASDRVEVAREEFEGISRGLVLETESVTRRLLDDLHLTPPEIDRVLLVGGSTRMPMIRAHLEGMFGRPPGTDVNPDECVACGAALRAAALSGHAIMRRRSLGGGAPERTRALSAGTLRDVTAHSLGLIVLSEDGREYRHAVILPRNTPIPAEASEVKEVRTAPGRDNQLDVYLLQGSSPRPIENDVLGRFTFHDVPHRDGRTMVRIAYRYDRSTIARVSAVDEQTGCGLGEPEFTPPPFDLSWTERTVEPAALPAALPARIAAVLCIDLSGSMKGARLEEAKRGALEFCRQIGDAGGYCGLVGFSDTARVRVPLGPPGLMMNLAIRGLGIEGGTYLATGLEAAGKELFGWNDRRANRGEPPARRVLLVLTDGETFDAEQSVSIAGQLRQQGVEIVAVGTGDADRAFLARIASSDALNLFVEEGGISGAFGTIARDITRGSLR